jgi:hypothetical protein
MLKLSGILKYQQYRQPPSFTIKKVSFVFIFSFDCSLISFQFFSQQKTRDAQLHDFLYCLCSRRNLEPYGTRLMAAVNCPMGRFEKTL